MTMLLKSNRRCHVDDSFYQLGLLDLRVGMIAPLELGTREMIAGVERRWIVRLRQLG